MKTYLIVIGLLVVSAASAWAQPQSDFVDVGRGPVRLYYPSDYDGTQSLPLIVGLHGFTGSGVGFESYFDLTSQIEERQFMYLIPDGSRNFAGLRFWNATEACCGANVDDSSYLRDLVEAVQQDYAVDDRSIHFTGHSNGGFMSHRMAIDHADMVASIASLAGANYIDAAAHDPSEPVHVLQIHGTADSVIQYNGGSAFAPYPGAEQTVLNWVGYNGLSAAEQVSGEPFNLDGAVPRRETTNTIYDPNNDQGIGVELWTLEGSGHSPAFGNTPNNRLAPRVVDWLLTHTKSNPFARCDFDENGSCDLADVDAMFLQGPIGSGVAVDGSNEAYDLNGDGQIDLLDRDAWLAEAATENGFSSPYLVGDANLDGGVDVGDFNQWNANQFQSTLLWSNGNFNGDANVDVGDFNLWNANKFQSSDAAAVPEPHGIVMMLMGLVWWSRIRSNIENLR